jgi:hypothetical protein
MITLGGRATKKLEDSDRERGSAIPGSASVNKKTSVSPRSITDFADKFGL